MLILKQNFESKSCKENTKLLHDLGGCGISVGRSTAKDNSKDKTLFNALLKSELVFGCLTSRLSSSSCRIRFSKHLFWGTSMLLAQVFLQLIKPSCKLKMVLCFSLNKWHVIASLTQNIIGVYSWLTDKSSNFKKCILNLDFLSTPMPLN